MNILTNQLRNSARDLTDIYGCGIEVASIGHQLYTAADAIEKLEKENLRLKTELNNVEMQKDEQDRLALKIYLNNKINEIGNLQPITRKLWYKGQELFVNATYHN